MLGAVLGVLGAADPVRGEEVLGGGLRGANPEMGRAGSGSLQREALALHFR